MTRDQENVFWGAVQVVGLGRVLGWGLALCITLFTAGGAVGAWSVSDKAEANTAALTVQASVNQRQDTAISALQREVGNTSEALEEIRRNSCLTLVELGARSPRECREGGEP